jgi:hypothetical protein
MVIVNQAELMLGPAPTDEIDATAPARAKAAQTDTHLIFMAVTPFIIWPNCWPHRRRLSYSPSAAATIGI